MVFAGIVADLPKPSGEVVHLSACAEDYRKQFVNAVTQIEKLVQGFPGMAAIRGNLASDSMLAGRMRAIAEKLVGDAAFLERRDIPAAARR